MNLMPDEKILWESKSKNLVLTTHRVRSQSEAAGQSQIKSIMLEELASCSMTRASNPALLVLAALCAVLGLLGTAGGREPVFLIAGIVVGGIFVLAFFVSRHQHLSFASAGATIRVDTQGMKVENMRQIIDAAEAAKNVRYLLLKG
jgi:uncharacterized membrane protein (UPF0136 family)